MAASDVLVASPVTGTGGILAGPLGTALNTDATTTPDAALKKAGFVGEDGVTMTVGRTKEKIRAWGGDTVRTVQTEHDVTFSFTFLETNQHNAGLLYGEENVEFTAADATKGNRLSIKLNSNPLEPHSWQLEMKDGKRRGRIVIPNGDLSTDGDTTFVHSAASSTTVTIEALPDENGDKAFIYWDDGEVTSA